MTQTKTAPEIAEYLLTETGDAMQDGDFERFCCYFTLPFVMETFEGRNLLRSKHELEAVFNSVRVFRQTNAITETIRENVAASFIDSETIAATHVSRMLQCGKILYGRPYLAYSVVKRFKDGWRIQFCQYAVEEPQQLNTALCHAH